jgi:hypothetical protein
LTFKITHIYGILTGVALVLAIKTIANRELSPDTPASKPGSFTTKELPAPSVIESAVKLHEIPTHAPAPNSKISFSTQSIPPDKGGSEQFHKQILMGTSKIVPKDLQKPVQEAYRKREAAFKNEELARSEIQNMATCVFQFRRIIAPMMPREVERQMSLKDKERVAQIPTLGQAQCIATARALAEKFPTLKQEFENNVLKKASSSAIEMERISKSASN